MASTIGRLTEPMVGDRPAVALRSSGLTSPDSGPTMLASQALCPASPAGFKAARLAQEMPPALPASGQAGAIWPHESAGPGKAIALMTSIVSIRRIYEGWLGLLMVRLRAGNGEEFDRHVVELGRAIGVLPYDPVHRTALLVSMPRAPVTLAGLPDMLEAIAGKLAGADPEECARREAMEEAGVRLTTLRHVGRVWPMPSNATEQIDYYLAPYSPSDRVEAGGGLVEEQENITVHEVHLADLWTWYVDKQLMDGKLITLLLALRVERPDLFSPC